MSDDATLKAIVDRMVERAKGDRLLIARMQAEEDGREAAAYAHKPRRLPLWERVVCYVLDSITRALDAFTRWVEQR